MQIQFNTRTQKSVVVLPCFLNKLQEYCNQTNAKRRYRIVILLLHRQDRQRIDADVATLLTALDVKVCNRARMVLFMRLNHYI